jgi:hypothetical protein
MGQFSVEKPVLPGSGLSGNQQNDRCLRILAIAPQSLRHRLSGTKRLI